MSRFGSAGQKSDRSLKMTPLHLPAGDSHPEEWTLPEVHKMEKRETFNSWYSDLQANILNCARKINQSLAEHPHPNANLTVDDINESHYVIETETERVMNDVYGRHTKDFNPIFYHLSRDKEIRLYKGL